jgi:hypothetical protein
MANDGSNVGWTPAPGESHLFAWRYLDSRMYPGLTMSRLGVIFRAKDGGEGQRGYYLFSNADRGQALADEMTAAGHPYGEVLYPKIIKPKAAPWVKGS